MIKEVHKPINPRINRVSKRWGILHKELTRDRERDMCRENYVGIDLVQQFNNLLWNL